MITGKNGQLPRKVGGLNGEKERDIAMYLKGMVYGWCESRGTEPFAAHNLVGGVNWDWKGTPLQCVYEKQTHAKKAYEVAGQEAGRLLELALRKDQREFTCEKKGRGANHYTWDGKYPKKQ